MKKFLLTLAAAAITTGAWAQELPAASMIPESYIDITPAYYKFYEGNANLDAMLRAEVDLPVAFNLGNDNWVSKNSNGKGENYFSAEQVANGNFLFGAWVMNNNKKNEYKDAFSLYSLGRNVGSALIINYQNSKLNEAIKEALDLEVAPEIPTFSVAAGGNFNFFALLDFNAMNDYLLLVNPDLDADMLPNVPEEIKVTPIRIHVRLVLNAYNNDPEIGSDAFTFTYFQNEASNTFGVEAPADGSAIAFNQFVENGKWNPYGWLVREYEFNYTGIAGAQKFQASGILPTYNDGATLIRSIEVYVVPADEEQLPNIEGKNYSANYDSWLDLSKNANPVLYVVGNNINGTEDWDKGGEMDYDNGVYTWTGTELGSGFKINNGTWDDEFNIGAGEGKLVLGTPYKVSIGDGTGNIEFEDYIAVKNPKVVFDPVTNTITVTGEGVEPSLPEGPIDLYIVGFNVNGAADWDAGLKMTYDESKDLYTWSGTQLGSGFKINNGTWAAEFNIGAGEGKLILGDPYNVAIGDGTGNIEFAGDIEVVYNPEVTFSLTNKVLTVTGEASGLDTINKESNAVVEYYNLQGVKVANPEKGIIIKKQGDSISKVMIR